MYEDAFCNNPCGMEPMGCRTCDIYSQPIEAEHYSRKSFHAFCLMCSEEWYTCTDDTKCPNCGEINEVEIDWI